jgi:hypothetical protein
VPTVRTAVDDDTVSFLLIGEEDLIFVLRTGVEGGASSCSFFVLEWMDAFFFLGKL